MSATNKFVRIEAKSVCRTAYEMLEQLFLFASFSQKFAYNSLLYYVHLSVRFVHFIAYKSLPLTKWTLDMTFCMPTIFRCVLRLTNYYYCSIIWYVMAHNRPKNFKPKEEPSENKDGKRKMTNTTEYLALFVRETCLVRMRLKRQSFCF